MKRALLGLPLIGAAVAVYRIVNLTTPGPAAELMVRLMQPSPGHEVYDPCCGCGMLLLQAHRYVRGRDPDPRGLTLYGQEIDPVPLTIGRMAGALLRADARLAGGDSMKAPAFTEPGGGLKRVDIALANPMWDQHIPASFYEHDRRGRFGFGPAPPWSADWAWVQHGHAALKDDGRMAIVINADAAGRGSAVCASSYERSIRASLVDADLVEAVLVCAWDHEPPRGPRGRLLRPVLEQGAIVVVNRAKRRSGEVLFVNARPLVDEYLERRLGVGEVVERVAGIHRDWVEVPGVSAIASSEVIAGQQYDLSPARYVYADQ